MTFEYYGAEEQNTVWSGVRALSDSGMWIIAAVVFIASMVVPVIKIVSLFVLALSVKFGRGGRFRTTLYRFAPL